MREVKLTMRRSLTCTTPWTACVRSMPSLSSRSRCLDQYKPARTGHLSDDEGFDRTWQLYLKLEALRNEPA